MKVSRHMYSEGLKEEGWISISQSKFWIKSLKQLVLPLKSFVTRHQSIKLDY